VSSRRGVDHEAVVAARGLELREGQQRHRLIGARERGVDQPGDVVAIEVGSAVHDRDEGVPPSCQKGVARRHRIELCGVEPRTARHRPRRLGDGDPDRVGERACGIRGEQQRAGAPPRAA
jgi:hypothetical protein